MAKTKKISKFKYLRKYFGLTQQYFEEMKIVPQSCISNFESGKRGLSVETINNLIKHLKKNFGVKLTVYDFVINKRVDDEFKMRLDDARLRSK